MSTSNEWNSKYIAPYTKNRCKHPQTFRNYIITILKNYSALCWPHAATPMAQQWWLWRKIIPFAKPGHSHFKLHLDHGTNTMTPIMIGCGTSATPHTTYTTTVHKDGSPTG